MKTKFSLWALVAVVILVGLAAWAVMREKDKFEGDDYEASYEDAPEAVSVTDQAADMTDLEAELTTFDADFDSDLNQLDKELQEI